MRKGTWVICGVLAACCGAFGQTPAAGRRVTFDLPVAPPAQVVDAPYSASEQWDRVQTLEDGTHITTSRAGNTYFRDAQGRVRTESFAAGSSQIVIDIMDPVAGFEYVLDPAQQVVHRMLLPTAAEGHSTVMAIAAAARVKETPTPAASSETSAVVLRPEFTSTRLPARMVDGLHLEGTRFHTTYPVGAIGNDQVVRNISEVWTSPDLKLMVTSNSIDPRIGQETFRLVNLSRETPDPALFQIPAGFTLVEEHGPFAITLQ